MLSRTLLRQLFRVELPQVNRLLCDEMARWPLREMRELLDTCQKVLAEV